MDEIVKQALVKWPKVPACYGWLGLDARGNWYLRDEQAQMQGPFSGGRGAGKGDELRHAGLIDFIARNYERDAQGRWYFQNGPQRVYVELEATPLIWRVNADFSLHDHLGRAAHWQACCLDEQGRLYLQTDTGFGLVHSMDTGYAADAIEQGRWPLQDVLAADLPLRFGYVMSPQLQQRA
jgi:hypothetical protein